MLEESGKKRWNLIVRKKEQTEDLTASPMIKGGAFHVSGRTDEILVPYSDQNIEVHVSFLYPFSSVIRVQY